MMKHINEYNVFDKMEFDLLPSDETAKELAKVIEARLLDGETVKVVNIEDGAGINSNFLLSIKYQQSNDGNMLITLDMTRNTLTLHIKSDYTIDDIHEYETNVWRAERQSESETWEDLLFKLENPISKGLEHMDTLNEIEKKLKSAWNESTYSYPLRKASTIEKGKVIYNVK